MEKLSKKKLDFYIDEINDILSSGQGDYYIDDWHEKSLKELYKTIPVEHRLIVYSTYLKSLKGPEAMTPLKGEKEFMKQLFSNKIKESIESKVNSKTQEILNFLKVDEAVVKKAPTSLGLMTEEYRDLKDNLWILKTAIKKEPNTKRGKEAKEILKAYKFNEFDKEEYDNKVEYLDNAVEEWMDYYNWKEVPYQTENSNKMKESVKSKLKESRPSAMSLEEITSIIGEMNNTISGPSEEGKPGVCIVYFFEKEQLDKLCSKYGIEYEIIEKFVDGNGDECLEVREKQLKENKNIMSKKKQIELLEGEIEKLAGKKVKLVESSIECSCKKDKLTEAKKDKEEKEEEEVEVEDTAVAKSDEAALKAATEDASEPILGNIIPASVIKEIDAYVTNTLAEIDKATTQLRAIKKQITSGATASNEDFSTLTDRIAFLVKQLSRVALYSNNTIKANKFDKALLDKIFDQKEL